MTQLDMLPYVLGDGREYVLKNNFGTEELVYTDRLPGGVAYLVKNHKYEKFHWDDHYIYRTDDISAADDELYRVNNGSGAPWCPRMMQVGQTFDARLRIDHYKYDGRYLHGGEVVHHVTLAEYHPHWTFQSGVTLADVIKVVIELPRGNIFDTIWFAKDYGLAGHQGPSFQSWFSYEARGIRYPRQVIDWLGEPVLAYAAPAAAVVSAPKQPAVSEAAKVPNEKPVRRRALLPHGKSNIRADAQTTAAIVGELLHMDMVDVFSEQKVVGSFTWQRITKNTVTGWVAVKGSNLEIRFEDVHDNSGALNDALAQLGAAQDRLTSALAKLQAAQEETTAARAAVQAAVDQVKRIKPT